MESLLSVGVYTIVYRMGIPWADYARREQDMKMTAQ